MLWANEGIVNCYQDDEKVGTLFDGKTIAVDEKGLSKTYHPSSLNRSCQAKVDPSHEGAQVTAKVE